MFKLLYSIFHLQILHLSCYLSMPRPQRVLKPTFKAEQEVPNALSVSHRLQKMLPVSVHSDASYHLSTFDEQRIASALSYTRDNVTT
jgi:hypothetical protein